MQHSLPPNVSTLDSHSVFDPSRTSVLALDGYAQGLFGGLWVSIELNRNPLQKPVKCLAIRV